MGEASESTPEQGNMMGASAIAPGAVNIRGVQHYYEWISPTNQDGEPGKSDRPVMVFVHGWGPGAHPGLEWKGHQALP